MNRIEIYQLFLLAGLFAFSACQLNSTTPTISKELKKSSARLLSDQAPKPEEKVIMIYDYNASFSGLEYRPVTLKNPTGNQLQDALNAFFEHNHFLDNIDPSKLITIVKEEEETILYIKEMKEESNKRNSLFFKEALELTMTRSITDDRISVVIKDDIK